MWPHIHTTEGFFYLEETYDVTIWCDIWCDRIYTQQKAFSIRGNIWCDHNALWKEPLLLAAAMARRWEVKKREKKEKEKRTPSSGVSYGASPRGKKMRERKMREKNERTQALRGRKTMRKKKPNEKKNEKKQSSREGKCWDLQQVKNKYGKQKTKIASRDSYGASLECKKNKKKSVGVK